jgi:hypothetical protein
MTANVNFEQDETDKSQLRKESNGQKPGGSLEAKLKIMLILMKKKVE